MKKILFGLLAVGTLAFAVPASVQTADAQVVVKERTVVRSGMRPMARRCVNERTKIYRRGREVTIVKRICR